MVSPSIGLEYIDNILWINALQVFEASPADRNFKAIIKNDVSGIQRLYMMDIDQKASGRDNKSKRGKSALNFG